MTTYLISKEFSEIKDLIANQFLVYKDIMSLKEAALYMGVSKSYVYKLTCSRQISFSRPGSKLIYFKKTDLDEWMLRNKEPSYRDESVIPSRKFRKQQ